MEITWNHSFKQIAAMLGLQEKPWLIDAYWEEDASQALGGRQIGDVPMQELAQLQMMQDRQSIVDGFNFLTRKYREGDCLYSIWDAEQCAADPQKEKTGLFAFPVPGAKRFLLIVPGGGYFNVCSFVEGFPIAKRCNELGISAFVLQYRCSGAAHYPNPQEDAAQAVRFILNNREQFGLNGADYAICGFSAGGHLSASFSAENLGYGRFGVPRPQAVILGYPVITMSDLTHDGSRQNLLKEDAGDAAIRELYSVEKQVTSAYPPTFIWNCAEDGLVPHENSDMLEAALHRCGVPVTHEVYPGTVHGWGLADGTPAENWLDRAISFWAENA